MTQKQIDDLNIQVGDYVRCEWVDGNTLEGTITHKDGHGLFVINGKDAKITGNVNNDCFDPTFLVNKKSIQVLRRAMEKDVVCKENLVAGETVIIDNTNGESLVLEVGETSFLRSCWGEFDQASGWYAYVDAQRRGWKIKLPSDTVEFNGKKYKKEEVEERLKELKAIES